MFRSVNAAHAKLRKERGEYSSGQGHDHMVRRGSSTRSMRGNRTKCTSRLELGLRERGKSARAGWHTPGHNFWGPINIPLAGSVGNCRVRAG
jgi:hypothetical protein